MPMIGPLPAWSLPPESLMLKDDEVHVWCASLNLVGSHVQSLLHTLSVDERARAERLRVGGRKDVGCVAETVRGERRSLEHCLFLSDQSLASQLGATSSATVYGRLSHRSASSAPLGPHHPPQSGRFPCREAQ